MDEPQQSCREFLFLPIDDGHGVVIGPDGQKTYVRALALSDDELLRLQAQRNQLPPAAKASKTDKVSVIRKLFNLLGFSRAFTRGSLIMRKLLLSTNNDKYILTNDK